MYHITLTASINQIPSSFFKPLTVLLHAALKFSDPPNETDTKVITALKKHWSMMVIRVSLPLIAVTQHLFWRDLDAALEGAGELPQTSRAIYI